MIGFILNVIFFPASWMMNLVPIGVRKHLSQALGFFVFHLFPFREKVLRSNLRLAFGSRLSEEELSQLVLKNYQHYCACVVEWIQAVTWTHSRFRREIQVHGLENVARSESQTQGGYVLAGHIGNWELTIGAAVAYGLPASVVVKKFRTRIGQELLSWFRLRLGAQMIEETKSTRDILRALSQNKLVGFVLDQFMGPPIGVPVRFFGHEAGTAAALALMTERGSLPVYLMYTYRDKNFRLHLVIEPPFSTGSTTTGSKSERIYKKAQMYNDAIERVVCKYPEQWLWLHKRWKPFVGESRWALPSGASLQNIAFVFLLVMGLACSSSTPKPPLATEGQWRGEKETGIAVPPDPKVDMPQVVGETEPTAPEPPSITPPMIEQLAPSKPKRKSEIKAQSQGASSAASSTAVVPVKAVPVDKIPFEIGERMEIDLNWMALPAGRAVIEVREGPIMNSRPTLHFWGNVLSSKLVDTIYHVDNTIESFVDRAAILPYKFLLSMVETQQSKETRVMFDHSKNKAHYWSKRISKRWGNDDQNRQDNFTPLARDMFSAMYYARVFELKLGEKITFPLYENNQNFEVEMIPTAIEMLHTRVGVFQCWKIRCLVRVNNVLSPTGDVFLWLSKDSKRYIVKFEAKIKIGSVYGNLVGLRDRL